MRYTLVTNKCDDEDSMLCVRSFPEKVPEAGRTERSVSMIPFISSVAERANRTSKPHRALPLQSTIRVIFVSGRKDLPREGNQGGTARVLLVLG